MLQPRGHSTDYTSPSWWAHTSATFSQTSLFFLLLLLLLLHLSLFCLTLSSPPGVSNLNTSPWVKPVPPLPACLSVWLTATQHSATTTKKQKRKKNRLQAKNANTKAAACMQLPVTTSAITYERAANSWY